MLVTIFGRRTISEQRKAGRTIKDTGSIPFMRGSDRVPETGDSAETKFEQWDNFKVYNLVVPWHWPYGRLVN